MEEILKDINKNLERIADALERLAGCVDGYSHRLSIEGEVGSYEESPY